MNRNKQLAIDKVESEINKNIQQIELLTKQCGWGELLFFIYYLHFVRILHLASESEDTDKEVLNVYQLKVDDAYKYLIQCIYTNCKKEFVLSEDGFIINNELTILLTKLAIQLNKNHEALSFLSLFENVELKGERNQKLKFNLEEVRTDSNLFKYMTYGARVDVDNNRKKVDFKIKEDFINGFRNEYIPYQDLFQSEFKISLDRFIEILNYILEYIENNIKSKLSEFTTLENGKIDVQNYNNILRFISGLFIPKIELQEKFGGDEVNFLKLLEFQPSEFDIKELRFNLSARQPLFNINNDILVSPELLLDSLYINSHYSLLESEKIKNEYKKRYSDNFVNSIAKVGQINGYIEKQREVELYDKKVQLGDIDLVLFNENTNHYLLIEAKNHKLPLNVYFHDFEATKERLVYLQNEWEKKVNKRINHLKSNYSSYGIGESFDYIVVTKQPEILSHFSSLLVFCEDEFKEWINKYQSIKDIEVILEKIYEFDNPTLTNEQQDEIRKEFFSGWELEK